MNIYIGNQPYSVREEQLRSWFEEYGTVERATVVIDRFTGRSRGFGFGEMPNEQEARRAIEALNGSELEGRTLVVNLARPRSESPQSGCRMASRSGRRW
ncbi:MAG: RNA-binding protein [Candidatus Kapabacteria bacterium]|nr:RNA-binding protein [Candidatus Kapabacteria bacterium]MDW8012179.1 RNA-binding protein [Bacteroidota bacterium]